MRFLPLKKEKKGFTLVEIIVAMAILALVVVTLLPLMKNSVDLFNKSSDKFGIQSNISYASSSLNEAVRESTGIFVLAKNKYDPDKVEESQIPSGITSFGLTQSWNYIGPNKEGTKIYNFVWDEKTSKHIPFELTLDPRVGNSPVVSDIRYALEISDEKANIQEKISEYRKMGSTLTTEQKKDMERLKRQLEDQRSFVRYSIVAKYKEQSVGASAPVEKEYKIDSIVEAINTKQVIDITNGEKPTAIAYRTTALPSMTNSRVKPMVAMALDFSGSMKSGLEGNSRIFYRMTTDSSGNNVPYVRDLYSVVASRFFDPENNIGQRFFYIKQKFNDKDGYIDSNGKFQYYVIRYILQKDSGGYYFKAKNSNPKSFDSTAEIIRWDEIISITPEFTRTGHLKREYVELIRRFENISDMKVFLIPFSSKAYTVGYLHTSGGDKSHYNPGNMIGELKKVYELKRGDSGTGDNKKIEDLLINIDNGGGTNYGDGVYYGLEQIRRENSPNSYLLVLSDGQPYSHTESIYNSLPIGTPDTNNSFPSNQQLPMAYIKRVIDAASFKPKFVYLIGFSSVQSDNAMLGIIKGYFDGWLGSDNVKKIEAGSADSLNLAFSSFAQDINDDLWYFNGP